jgi:hypothetical protein
VPREPVYTKKRRRGLTDSSSEPLARPVYVVVSGRHFGEGSAVVALAHPRAQGQELFRSRSGGRASRGSRFRQLPADGHEQWIFQAEIRTVQRDGLRGTLDPETAKSLWSRQPTLPPPIDDSIMPTGSRTEEPLPFLSLKKRRKIPRAVYDTNDFEFVPLRCAIENQVVLKVVKTHHTEVV